MAAAVQRVAIEAERHRFTFRLYAPHRAPDEAAFRPWRHRPASMLVATRCETRHAATWVIAPWRCESDSVDRCGTAKGSADRGQGPWRRRSASPYARNRRRPQFRLNALQRALEAAGVEFTNGDQPAVRLTKAAAAGSAEPASGSKPTVAAKKVVRAKTAKATGKKR
jgi:hypothetical protein